MTILLNNQRVYHSAWLLPILGYRCRSYTYKPDKAVQTHSHFEASCGENSTFFRFYNW